MKVTSWEELQKKFSERVREKRGMKEVLDAHLAEIEQENASVEKAGVPEKE